MHQHYPHNKDKRRQLRPMCDGLWSICWMVTMPLTTWSAILVVVVLSAAVFVSVAAAIVVGVVLMAVTVKQQNQKNENTKAPDKLINKNE